MEDRIIKVLNHIEAHIHSALELKDLAALACLSPSQFHRQFKRQTGRTPFKFAEELKMNKAYQLILDGSWLISALSSKLGYRDYETFSRTFKKYFHFSPDDLKAIVEGVKSQVESNGQTEVMVLTLDDSYSEEEVKQQLLNFLEDKSVSRSDLMEAQAFKIVPKEIASRNDKIIKNKFALNKEDKLWKSLIDIEDKSQIDPN